MLYNEQRRVHAVKFQQVLASNGINENLFRTMEGKRHYTDILWESNLLTNLQQVSFDTDGQPMCLYGDPAYPVDVYLLSPFIGVSSN